MKMRLENYLDNSNEQSLQTPIQISKDFFHKPRADPSSSYLLYYDRSKKVAVNYKFCIKDKKYLRSIYIVKGNNTIS